MTTLQKIEIALECNQTVSVSGCLTRKDWLPYTIQPFGTRRGALNRLRTVWLLSAVEPTLISLPKVQLRRARLPARHLTPITAPRQPSVDAQVLIAGSKPFRKGGGLEGPPYEETFVRKIINVLSGFRDDHSRPGITAT